MRYSTPRRSGFSRYAQQPATGPRPLAVFDCDGTVIQGEHREAMFYRQIEHFHFRRSPASVWPDHPRRTSWRDLRRNSPLCRGKEPGMPGTRTTHSRNAPGALFLGPDPSGRWKRRAPTSSGSSPGTPPRRFGALADEAWEEGIPLAARTSAGWRPGSPRAAPGTSRIRRADQGAH